jgi:uncharacterized protein (TIRG00374 family)
MRRLISIAIGLFLTLWLIWWLDVDLETVKKVKRLDLIALATLIGIFLIQGIATIRMKMLLSIIKCTGELKTLLVIEFINKFIYTVAPGRLNVPAKAFLLKKLCGTGLKNGISLSTFEYALDAYLVVLIGSVGGMLLFGGFTEIRYFLLLMLALTLGLFLMPPATFDHLSIMSHRIRSAFVRSVFDKAIATLKTLRATWAALLVDPRFFTVAFYTILLWGVRVVTIKLLFLSVGLSIPFSWIFVVTALSLFIGGITGIPGGLGAKEASMVFLYGLLGVPTDLSVIVAIANRLIVLPVIIIGYVLTLQLGLSFQKET